MKTEWINRLTDSVTIVMLIFILAISFQGKWDKKKLIKESVLFSILGIIMIPAMEILTNRNFYAYCMIYIMIGVSFCFVSLKGERLVQIVDVIYFGAAFFELSLLEYAFIQMITNGELGSPRRFLTQIGLLVNMFSIWYNPLKKIKSPPKSFLFVILCTSCLCYAMPVIFFRQFIEGDAAKRMYCMIGAVIWIIQLLVFYLTGEACRVYEEKLSLHAVNVRLEQDYQSIEGTKRILNDLIEVRHEWKNHIFVMDGLAKRGDYEQLKQYLGKLSDMQEPIDERIRSGRSVIDVVLIQKLNIASHKGIAMRIRAQIPSCAERIEDTDLVSLISNLLNNAIEASEKIEDGEIEIDISPVKNYLSIKVLNSAPEDIFLKNPTLNTMKQKQPEIHGVGIKVIRMVTKKYDGMCAFSMEDKRFVANVMLRMADSDEIFTIRDVIS